MNADKFYFRTLPPGAGLAATVVLMFGFARLWNLGILPVFSDEAIYIHWAQLIADDPNRLFLPRVDGKQPLFMWLNALFLPGFDDPAASGRLVSVLAGFFTLAGVALIARRLFSAPVALAAGAIYALCPFAVFFDRLAVVDSLLCAFGAWIAYYALKIAQGSDRSLKCFLALGAFMGLAFLTKAPALLLWPLPVFFLLAYGAYKERIVWARLAVAVLIACLLILPYIFSGQGVGVLGRDFLFHKKDYFLSPGELLAFPWRIWIRNLVVTLNFYLGYMTMPVLALLAYEFFSTLRRPDRDRTALWVWALFPALCIVVLANGFFSRYFLLTVPPLTILAAAAAFRLSGQIKTWLAKIPAVRSTDPKKLYWVYPLFLVLILSDAFFLSMI